MPTLHERIRRARALSGLTQQALARRLGVQRGAVTQWEHPDGSTPSMKHLIAIAEQTGVHLEWLGTGRGVPRPDPATAGATAEPEDRIHDTLELECLIALRRVPRRVRLQIVGLLRAIAR